MSEHNEGKGEMITGHEYDGIHELDNPLPRWWLILFYITIVYGIGYFTYYHLFGGPTLDEELATALAKLEGNAAAQVADAAGDPEEPIDIDMLLKDPNAIVMGKGVYEARCAACHGALGEGLIGPNLADGYWIHSKGDSEGILLAIREGFPAKGMPPWKELIPKDQHAPLAAYVMSLHGTNPPNAKGPEGEEVVR